MVSAQFQPEKWAFYGVSHIVTGSRKGKKNTVMEESDMKKRMLTLVLSLLLCLQLLPAAQAADEVRWNITNTNDGTKGSVTLTTLIGEVSVRSGEVLSIADGDTVTLTVSPKKGWKVTKIAVLQTVDSILTPRRVLARVYDTDTITFVAEICDCDLEVTYAADETAVTVAPPVILRNPQDVTVMEGEPIVVSVEAAGENLHYEWKQVDAGATTIYSVDSPTFTFAEHAEKSIHSSYFLWCRVWNEGGSVESEKAWVWVDIPEGPEIIRQPASVILSEGDPLEISVEASGANLTYRWTMYRGDDSETYFDDVMNTPIVRFADECNYEDHNGMQFSCYIFNEYGEVVSNTATVTVLPKLVAKPFRDVAEKDWYYRDVQNAVKLGLLSGMEDGRFAPKANLTYAQALKLACCMHQRYYQGEVTLTNSASGKWYDSYYQYAEDQGLLTPNYNLMNEPIPRMAFVGIFYTALPAGTFTQINPVADGAIPDVPMDAAYAQQIYAFYRAGILTGSDAVGSFRPESSILRGEVAAILSRMMDGAARKCVVLPVPDASQVDIPSCWTAAGDHYVFFTTLGGLPAVDFGTWEFSESRGPALITAAIRSGEILDVYYYGPPLLEPADEQDTRPITGRLSVWLGDLEQDGRLRITIDGGDELQYADGGETWQEAYNSVH